MLGLGGWVDSTAKYGEMLRNQKSRQHLVQQISEFLITHNFDGLELDILYPGAYQVSTGGGGRRGYLEGSTTHHKLRYRATKPQVLRKIKSTSWPSCAS